jgi:hypothetical protein
MPNSVKVYYDYMDDWYCEIKEYHFDTEENASKFQKKAVETHQMVFVAPIEKKENTSLKLFTSDQDAIDDLKVFLDRAGNRSLHGVYRIPLVCLQLLIYQSECARLEEEIQELRLKLEEKERR